jgi:hypothetical protein
VAKFQYNGSNSDLQADVAGYARELLKKWTDVDLQINGYSVNIRFACPVTFFARFA